MRICFSGLTGLLLYCLVQGASACVITQRDQISLKEVIDAAPAAGSVRLLPWPTNEVLCAKIQDLRVLSIPGQSSFYVLDPKRVFDRWSETGAGFIDAKTTLVRFVRLYRGMDAETLWLNYGRVQFTPGELANVSPDLKWTKVRLIAADTLTAAARKPLNNPDREALIWRLVRDQVRSWVAANSDATASAYEVKNGSLRLYTNAVFVTVSVRRNDRVDRVELRLPINVVTPPYVGYPDGREVQ